MTAMQDHEQDFVYRDNLRDIYNQRINHNKKLAA